MANFERKVLVLDSRFEPVKVVSLEIGFVLLYTQRAETVIESERTIRTVARTYEVPWIIRLLGCSPRHRRQSAPRFSRQNVYLRDSFSCQYCSWTGPLSNLTLDHLIPCARGGRTTWENIVTACRQCNMRKGARTPEECGIRLKKLPLRPEFHSASLFALRFGLNRQNTPSDWLPYLDLSITDQLPRHLEASISSLNQIAS